ncbi:MAG: hypothetical protein II584_02570 [Treponema sp.]|nr:hypothetical protein [Treponema sp.]
MAVKIRSNGSLALPSLLLVLVLALPLASCSRNRTIDISDSNSIELSPTVDWALVREPYAAFRKDPSFESPVASHARRGEIMRLLGKKYVTTGTGKNEHTTVWYSFEQGWLDESLVTLYDNKFKAQAVADSYTE